jgi:long-chain acyl-CoA synthetase
MQLDLELYREEVLVSEKPAVRISVIDISPERPEQTLVLIHGFGGRARQWRYQIESFAERNRVLAFDLRGHGRSSRPLSGYEMPKILDDIIRTLDARGVTEPFVLVGHSFGGAIVTELAYHYPERVNKLVLIASAGEYKIQRMYRVAFQLPDPLLKAIQPAVRGLIDASVPALKRFFLQNLRHWQGWDLFPQLKPPTMFIMGEKDIVLPQEAFARVAELIPDAEVVNVGVSAHMVMLERRDAVNRAIERFIETDVADRHVRWRGGESGELEPGTGTLLAERPWLIHYESGVPFTIDIPRLPLTRLLDRAWRRFPRKPAIIYQGRSLSYKTLCRGGEEGGGERG